MSDKSLVALVHDFADLDRQLIESNGELTPQLESELQITEENVRSKVDRYKLYTDHLESRAMYFKDIEEQAKSARRLFENHRERLRETLKFSMHAMDRPELVGNDWRYTLSPGKKRLVIVETEIPDKYKVPETVYVLDKAAIEADLQMGYAVPGAKLEDTETLRSYINHAGKAKPVKEKSK